MSEKAGAGPATPEQIRELPRRYAIGKRPLSRLLGWGELTYTRLLNGGVPNAAHSNEIRRLLDDPAAYARLLEIGHEHAVITGAAYSKSRRAVDALLAEGGRDEAGDPLKIFAVADRICALTGGDVTPRALQMLMHAAQERTRETGGEALFEQEPVATDWGFEYPQIAAGYSFEAIQSVAARMRGPVATTGSIAPAKLEPARELEAAEAAEPEPEPIGKKGKKAKKDKKGKGKKKGKKAKRAAKLTAEATMVAAAEAAGGVAPSREPEPAAPEPSPTGAPGTVTRGPLSPADCRIIDEVVTRYQQHLAAAFQ